MSAAGKKGGKRPARRPYEHPVFGDPVSRSFLSGSDVDPDWLWQRPLEEGSCQMPPPDDRLRAEKRKLAAKLLAANRKQRTEGRIRDAWEESTLPERNRAGAIAHKFRLSYRHVLRVVTKSGLRKKRT